MAMTKMTKTETGNTEAESFLKIAKKLGPLETRCSFHYTLKNY